MLRLVCRGERKCRSSARRFAPAAGFPAAGSVVAAAASWIGRGRGWAYGNRRL